MVDSIVKQAFGINTLADVFNSKRTGSLRKNKRVLHERSHLTLEFPQTDNRIIRAYVPFLENAEIVEKGSARLNTYDLVGRAGQLFSYAGADSRKLSVNFNISLLHLIEIVNTEGLKSMYTRSFLPFFTDRQSSISLFNLRKEAEEADRAANAQDLTPEDKIKAKAQFAKAKAEVAKAIGESDQTVNDDGRNYANIHREYYRKAIGALTGNQIDKRESQQLLAPLAKSLGIPTATQAFKELDKNINLIYCWVNLIRGAVLNNSRNSLYGPPIVRLTHGPMYNNVPCLMEDYSITIENDAGYESQTLTPKRLNISLNLVEFRTGNFGNYEATQVEFGDNLTGWESIISNNDIDPQNGLIGIEDLTQETAKPTP